LEPRVGAYLPDVPYLCHIRRAVEITDAQPYREISQYCQVHVDQVERVFHTLSYFDGLNFAARTKAAGFYSVGLMDETCPPSTVYAAYNHAGGEKDIRCYTYNHHEGGGSFHHLEKVKFLRNLWKM
jgi:cephalosporin-C deacetylase